MTLMTMPKLGSAFSLVRSLNWATSSWAYRWNTYSGPRFPLRTMRGQALHLEWEFQLSLPDPDNSVSVPGSSSTTVTTASAHRQTIGKAPVPNHEKQQGESPPGRISTNGLSRHVSGQAVLRDLLRSLWDQCPSCKYFKEQEPMLNIHKKYIF